MNKKKFMLKLVALTASAIVLTGQKGEVFASNLSDNLPQAGFSLVIDGGNSVGEVKDEVKGIIEKNKGTTGGPELEMTKAVESEENPYVIAESNIDFDKMIVEPIVKSESAKDSIGKTVEEDFTNLVIAQVNSYVNVRDYPDENQGNKIGKLYNNSVGELIETVDGWYKIKSGNCEGYVKAEYCVTGEEAVDVAKEVGTILATVNTTTLKVRQEPNTESTVMGLVPMGEELVVTEDLDGWVAVTIEEGAGYVSKEFVDLRTDFVRAESKSEEDARLAREQAEREAANKAAREAERKAGQAVLADASQASEKNGQETKQASAKPSISGSGLGVEVANFAMQFVGNPYVYGGTSLTHGADCSGFVMSVYKNFGVSLPHSSTADRKVGYDAGGMANAQPGDLICYSGHVGIYVGNGQIVHASTSTKGIIVGSAYYSTPLAVRRIF